ncbi:tRNA-guanine transglycosylase DpdA [Nannocystis pusilla]|uniref:tRNA-guanine transglycosylase DpdA n=1 Tax=Nannocystis pusilla TaxID=889268 RepID=A0A9X3ELX6_9BACT|nr:tRNA-guanine transglycosylase DpdA [Nannocystis pusilla]MCY1006458.1 tRNA-guanine transglycosylase DpdA [Nannocystis pusilla]
MKYFLPDSQDLVDPSFDFQRETRNPERIRHQDDHYAHEVFSEQGPVFDGILVSKAIVEGTGAASQAKYTQAQQRRILREGVRAFFRLEDHPWDRRIESMGDCGAFTYIKEEAPPFSVDEVINFYVRCGFDYGFSVDHVISEYKPQWEADLFGSGAPDNVRQRQKLTLALASEFFATHKRDKLPFTPIGVAQGWSPVSYAHAFAELQKIGFRYIALGGMVPLKTNDILNCLKAVSEVRCPETKIHLLGVTRFAHLPTFSSLGVASIDSTSPLRQAFMDDKDNYHTLERTYTAIRVPQVQGNFRLQARIRSGELDQEKTRKAEQLCLRRLEEYDAGGRSLVPVLKALRAYEELHEPDKKTRTESARQALEDSPWKKCRCAVCKQLKHHVILFRGAERNRRRGFHNVAVFYQRLRMLTGQTPSADAATKALPDPALTLLSA